MLGSQLDIQDHFLFQGEWISDSLSLNSFLDFPWSYIFGCFVWFQFIIDWNILRLIFEKEFWISGVILVFFRYTLSFHILFPHIFRSHASNLLIYGSLLPIFCSSLSLWLSFLRHSEGFYIFSSRCYLLFAANHHHFYWIIFNRYRGMNAFLIIHSLCTWGHAVICTRASCIT